MDFKLHRIFTGRMGSNAYLVSFGSLAAAIDAGMGSALADYAEKNKLKIEMCLLTHGHFDHIGACAELQRRGTKIGISEKDADKLYTGNNLGGEFGVETEPLHPDFTFRGGEEIDFHGFSFRVLETPGHSAGSVCFLTPLGIFSGDTLFCGGVGRTDFYDGDPDALSASLAALFAAKEDAPVYPGHGLSTTLKREKETNPYL